MNTLNIRKFAASAMVLALAALSACGKQPDAGAVAAGAAPSHEEELDESGKLDPLFEKVRDSVPHVVVAEAWVSPQTPEDNVDSPASWLQDGKLFVAATAKSTDQLIIYDGDTGERVKAIGGSGREPGRFSRPNGIATVDDRHVFVVERDNRRVQVLALPDFKPLFTFGEAELKSPYGLWVRKQDAGFEVLVSDAWTLGEDDQGEDILPPLEQLGSRFQRYAVKQEAGKWSATHVGSFGDTTAAGAIRVPESLFGDEHYQRLLIAEEDVTTGTRLREYSIDGRYAGRDVGAEQYRAQAEGISLMRCKDGTGWWVASDQYDDRTVFHVFGRTDLEWKGSFVGNVTGLTDGVWMEERGDARFPQGVFYASHLDIAVSAFDWRDIASALGLPACAR